MEPSAASASALRRIAERAECKSKAGAVLCVSSTPVLELRRRHAMAGDDGFKLSPELELEKIISLQTAEKVSGLSEDSWKRHHSDKLDQAEPAPAWRAAASCADDEAAG